ncbi:hypothetical protein ALC56_03059 [Trachymyrmex septentrionalis]|uniref:Uncharacterized protein n=1 Tax=Trachymyrmex septentrionalis TaxID=34720 RepID=A0A195FPX7_9HYME|nr:hypothetical protein ALC56_03059 [Trachymyrmex septentrionalis]
MVSRYDVDNDNDDGLSIDLARAIIGNFPPPRRREILVTGSSMTIYSGGCRHDKPAVCCSRRLEGSCVEVNPSLTSATAELYRPDADHGVQQSRAPGILCVWVRNLNPSEGSLRKMDDNSKQTVPERRCQQFFTRRVGVKWYRVSNGQVQRQIFSSLKQDALKLIASPSWRSRKWIVNASRSRELSLASLFLSASQNCQKEVLASRVSPGITIFHCRDIKREWIWHKQEITATSLHRSRLIFDVPTFLAMTSRAQPRGDPMKSNRRANPLQTTSRVAPERLVLENDVATSRSNWPAELRSGRQGPTITILLIADHT